MQAIASVKQEGNTITTYDEHGCMIGAATVAGGQILMGYTSNSFSTRADDGTIYVYNAMGICINAHR